MKNKLQHLNDHLFAQMERLGNENLTPEAMALEIDRGKAIIGISTQIIQNGRLVLDAAVAVQEYQLGKAPLMLGLEHEAA